MYRSTSSFAIITLLMVTSPFMSLTGFAQPPLEEQIEVQDELEPGEENEELAELNEQIDEARGLAESLRQRTERVDQRLSRLLKIRDALSVLRRLERTIDEAAERDDEETIERAEAQLEKQQLTIDESWDLLELSGEVDEILEAKRELQLEGITEFEKPLDALLKLQRLRIAITEKLFDALRSGREVDELEEELEMLSERFEGRAILLELQRELHFAREDGNEEAIEELEYELKRVRQNFADPEEDIDPQKSKKPRLLPIRLTDEEIRTAAAIPFSDQVLPKLKQACFDCHDSSQASGDLDLEALVKVQPLVIHRQDWINVIEQLKNHSMPPADHDQPSVGDRRILVAALSDAIFHFDYATVRRVGFEPIRRLTHDEYNHTVRDLFGVDIRPADRFPEDMSASSSFDNSANSLFIQPITMERYIGGARSIVEHVFAKENRDQIDRYPFAISRDNEPDVKSSIEQFLTRAFRRPVSGEEVDGYHRFFVELRTDGRDLDAALSEVVEAVLVSPSFLMRIEQPGQGAEASRVTEWELANRLSYFLWASMPDDELFRLAAAGELSQPSVLDRQIDRMLSDPRAETMGRIFASQWLGFANLGRLRPDQIDNPWATDSLVDAMVDESALFFASIVRDDQQIGRLIDADYTYLNEELAGHYGIDGVHGKQMRRVSLANSPRGGVLGQASILAITSFPGRTSPVLRGNWILSELLGTPPPPPPPNVSEFDERIAENRRLSARRKLELHRNNPNCYACHSQIDPLGFSLAKFDWFGRYRPRQRGTEVDDRGQFPDGTEFAGIDGLRQVILKDRMNDFVSQLSRKMLSYALGRQLEYYDEATVQEIIADVNHDPRIRVLIKAIVRSDTFQMKQSLKKPSNNEV